MLKIKEGIDLKELEKYGFKPHYQLESTRTGETCITHYYNVRRYSGRYGNCILFPKKKKNHSCIINSNSRTIANHLKYNSLIIDDRDFIDLDIIYDLIKDGLVEKVKE